MALQAYQELLVAVNELAEPLFDKYRTHLHCRKGCYFCCSDISVLPVEHFSVHRRLKDEGRDVGAYGSSGQGGPERESVARDRTEQGSLPVAPGEEGGRCGMLASDGSCSVYSVRPVICRVHGLPLAYPVYEYDQEGKLTNGSERMDLWCDLNFTKLSDEGAPRFFDRHGRVDMVLLNRRLEAINQRFLESEEGGPYRGVERLTLGTLLTERSRGDT